MSVKSVPLVPKKKINTDNDPLEGILEKWALYKEQLSKLEKKCEEYKKYTEKVMNKENKDTLSKGKYTVTRRKMSREYLTKKDVPSETWKNYCKKTEYYCFNLTCK